MIDIHCHILSGVDDGPDILDTSLEMARMAVADGIRTVIATPHIGDGHLKPDTIRVLVEELNDKLQELEIALDVLPGADVNVSLRPDLFPLYSIADSLYVLIEFPHMHLPSNARESIFRLVSQGLRPIITHPERNASIIRDPRIVESFIESGGLVQVTADSLAGEFGAEVRSCALYLLKKGFVHFLATDAHSSTWRPPILSRGVKIAQRAIGKEKALALVTSNPEAVLSGNIIHV